MSNRRVAKTPSAHPIALRPDAAAAALGVSSATLARLVSDGKIRRPVTLSRGVVLYDFQRLRSDWEALRDDLEAANNGVNPWDRVL
jgi:hypothetical protein